MAEQVEPGVTGLLVGREDVEGLAAALIEVASDPDRCIAWGEAARKRVAERFSVERMVGAYWRVCLDEVDLQWETPPSQDAEGGEGWTIGLPTRASC
jgi:glycosyltransferase involved in cell wall biosynthesis